MVIPLSVPVGAKAGQDLLAGNSNSEGCTAVFQADGSVHVTPVRLSDHGLEIFLLEIKLAFEFPRYNYEENNMKPYRFVYGSSIVGDKDTEDGVHIFSSYL